MLKFVKTWRCWVMGSEWKEKYLVDCLDKLIDYRGKTPKKAENGILTLSAKSVKNGTIDYSKAYYISRETYNKFMTRGFPKKGDILMTTEAPLGYVAKLDRDDVAIRSEEHTSELQSRPHLV